jgi:hypothetical protein
MRTILGGMVAAGMLLSTFTVAGAATVHKKKSTSKTVAKQSTGTASRSAPTSGTKTGTTQSATARRMGKKAPATTWRNRQLAPTPERYKEIQDALVAKGYLKPEDATGGWTQNSVDALKRFQAEQNIESTGKINSLSLIALGLGPKRDTTPPKPAAEPIQTDR